MILIIIWKMPVYVVWHCMLGIVMWQEMEGGDNTAPPAPPPADSETPPAPPYITLPLLHPCTAVTMKTFCMLLATAALASADSSGSSSGSSEEMNMLARGLYFNPMEVDIACTVGSPMGWCIFLNSPLLFPFFSLTFFFFNFISFNFWFLLQ